MKQFGMLIHMVWVWVWYGYGYGRNKEKCEEVGGKIRPNAIGHTVLI